MRYSKTQIVAMGLAAALLGLQTWMLLEHALSTPGHSPALLAAVPVVTLTLAALPVLIEHCLRSRAWLKAIGLLAVFALLVGYSLPQAVGRAGEARDSKLIEATASARPLKMMLDELATAKQRLADAESEVKRESRAGGCGLNCEKWKRTAKDREARVDQLTGDIARLAPPKVGAGDSPRIAAVLGISEATVNLYQPLFLPAAIEMGVWVLFWLAFSGAPAMAAAPLDTRPDAGAATKRPTGAFGTEAGDDADPVLEALRQVKRPVSNDELAALMGVSKGEASKRVAALRGRVAKHRQGRHVAISLH